MPRKGADCSQGSQHQQGWSRHFTYEASTDLHDFHLCGGGEQLGEASLQALPAHADVLALVCQELDEGGQQFQVAGWGHLGQNTSK